VSTDTQTIKTAFVSTPSGLKLGVLRDSLLAHGIRPLIPGELNAGSDWASDPTSIAASRPGDRGPCGHRASDIGRI
jgi:hypothetical protein